MKRSEINQIIKEGIDFINRMNFKLPVWAYWNPTDWKGKAEICEEIVNNMLGWDITDFGSNNYQKRGLFLFTIRNGNLQTKHNKTYAEKLMIVKEMQETPLHYHQSKMEDIINRGGGNLIMELYEAASDEVVSGQLCLPS